MPIDAATRVSPRLSAAIERIVNDPDREEAPTLGDVERILRRHSSDADRHDLLRHPQEAASLLVEMEALVEEFGPEALAVDFVTAKASESLSRVIERVIELTGRERRVTLASVRDAMYEGLVADLAGEGIIESDEEQTLQGEIDDLIERDGPDALAEEFIRFE